MDLAHSQNTWDVAVRFAHTLADEEGQPCGHWSLVRLEVFPECQAGHQRDPGNFT
jgi:hypothetical protein